MSYMCLLRVGRVVLGDRKGRNGGLSERRKEWGKTAIQSRSSVRQKDKKTRKQEDKKRQKDKKYKKAKSQRPKREFNIVTS